MKRRLLVALVVFLLTAGLAFVGFLWQQTNSPKTLDTAIRVEISRGQSLDQIAENFESSGVIANATLFKLLARFNQSDSVLLSGEYQFQGELSPSDVLEIIREGRVSFRSLRLAEGHRFQDYLEQLSNTPGLSYDLEGVDVKNAVGRFVIPYEISSVEGYFFPETYYYEVGDTASSILQRSLDLMEQELQRAWSKRSARVHLDRIENLLIVASLIEKETNWEPDRDRVSGVIYRRLEKNMRLQLDPSVIYALGDDFDGNLTRRHLDMDHPFNTYKNVGLPPSAICSPSRASLLAAAQPKQEDALYFVSRGDGTSEFSSTLAQHNRAVRQYQRR